MEGENSSEVMIKVGGCCECKRTCMASKFRRSRSMSSCLHLMRSARSASSPPLDLDAKRGWSTCRSFSMSAAVDVVCRKDEQQCMACDAIC